MLGWDFIILSRTYTHNWLRNHISWALSGIGVKIKSFLKCFFLQFLNFTALRYTVLFSYSKIYIAYVSITNEVDPLFFHCAHAYFHQFVLKFLDANFKTLHNTMCQLFWVFIFWHIFRVFNLFFKAKLKLCSYMINLRVIWKQDWKWRGMQKM